MEPTPSPWPSTIQSILKDKIYKNRAMITGMASSPRPWYCLPVNAPAETGGTTGAEVAGGCSSAGEAVTRVREKVDSVDGILNLLSPTGGGAGPYV
jgi:hypothetical protein